VIQARGATERQDDATQRRRLRNIVQQSRQLKSETGSCRARSRISAALQRLLDVMLDLFGTRRAIVSLYDGEAQASTIVAQAGFEESALGNQGLSAGRDVLGVISVMFDSTRVLSERESRLCAVCAATAAA
jgi:hypothetical protein